MNEIQRQISKAQWRINLGQFGWAFVWFVAGSLAVTGLLWLIPKIWAWETLRWGVSRDQWYWGSAAVCLAIGIFASSYWAWTRRAKTLDAAIEVDRRFGLRERLSSAIWLPESDRQSEAGQALLADAQARAQRIAIADEFRFHPRWSSALPLLPLMVLIGLYFVPDAKPSPQVKLNQVSQDNKKVKVEVEEIKKLVTEKAKELEEKGLQDMAEQMQALAKQLDREKGDHEQLKKEAMIKINDLRQQLEERQKEMGDAETIKSSLEQLKKVTKGPGEKMAEAMSQGDLEAAKKAVEELAQKLANGELTEMEKKQLAENLQKMADEVKKMQDKVAQQKAELEKQRDQAQQQGNSQKAADLQKQIDQLQKQQQAMNKMGELAKKLEQAANAMQQNAQQQSQKSNGAEPKPQDGQSPDKAANEQAQQALQDLAEEMQKIEADMESMEALKDLEDDLRECRDGMGKQIDGDNPNGQPNGEPMWKDWAKEGKEDSAGGGKRDIQENETGEYRSRVAGKIQKGETVISGTADGENLPGKSLIEVRDMVQASMSQQTDPLEDQQLPKNQREHARQYFESLRKGK